MRILFLLFSLIGWTASFFFYMKRPDINWQWLWLPFYILLQLSFLPKLDQIFSRFSVKRSIYSILLAVAWVYSSHTHAFSNLSLVMWAVTLIALGMFSLSLYCLIFLLEQPFCVKKTVPKSWWWGIIYGLIPAMVWIVYLLIYLPGKMTYDSFWQWDMAHHIMPYNAWHPVLHTLFIQATASIYNSPATYSMAQIILVSAIIGYALYNLQSFGLPIRWIIIVDLFYAINPVDGFYSISMWKDILFAAFILLLTVLFSKIYISKGIWLKNYSHMAAFVIVAFITMNLRDNGPAAVLAALIIFILLVKGPRKRMIMATLSVFVLYLLFNGPLMNALHVIKNPLNQALAVPSQQIAATYKNNGHFTPKLKRYFNRILPAENWSKDYNPYSVNPIKHDKLYDVSVINKSFTTYIKNWAHLLMLNPKIFVSAYLKEVSDIWQFQTNPKMTPYFTSPLDLQDYPWGIKVNAPTEIWKESKVQVLKGSYQHYVQESRKASSKLHVMPFYEYKKVVADTVAPLTTKSQLPSLKPAFNKVLGWVAYSNLRNYFLTGAIPLLLLFMALGAAIRRKGFRAVSVFLPAVFVLITIAMAMPAPDYRYSFSFVFTVPFLLWIGKIGVD